MGVIPQSKVKSILNKSSLVPGFPYQNVHSTAQHTAYTAYAERSEKSQSEAHDVTPYVFTPEFELVWCNRGMVTSKQNAVSIWRPVSPRRYAALGDCIVLGSYLAPRYACVLLDGPTPISDDAMLLAPPTVR